MNKHGLESFTFSVLEFCHNATELPTEEFMVVLIEMEQKYLHLVSDKYNINPNAGKSRLGSKHSEKTKEIFRKINGLTFLGKTHSNEYRAVLKARMSGANNHMAGKPVTDKVKKNNI
jgi:group I intron endonuclease